jgi:RNA polymerase sigma-70 factor (ECF subfamily)
MKTCFSTVSGSAAALSPQGSGLSPIFPSFPAKGLLLWTYPVHTMEKTTPNLSPEPEQHAQFQWFFDRYKLSLRTFIRSLVAAPEDADEVFQEVSVVLWQKFGDFDVSRDFRAWACGIARLKALSLFRDRQRDRHVFNEELLLKLASEAEAHESRHQKQREALENCLQKLPEAQRELVLAAYTKGNRMDELANQRAQTPMSLYKILHRTRLKLLECIQRNFNRETLA